MQISKLIDLKWRKGNINVMDDFEFPNLSLEKWLLH